MQSPLQIAFHGMGSSPAVAARIRERVERLERLHSRILACRVVVEAPPHRHESSGKLYAVRIGIAVPGRDIEVSHTGPLDPAHEDLYVAVHDAFDAAGRRLEDYARRSRDRVTSHAGSAA